MWYHNHAALVSRDTYVATIGSGHLVHCGEITDSFVLMFGWQAKN